MTFKSALKSSAAAAIIASAAALSACGGGGGSDGEITPPPPPPPPPAASPLQQLGAAFVAAFRASNNADPVDATSTDLASPNLTTDPFDPTNA